MKITVLDYHEKEKAESYFKGFDTGVTNTVSSIVHMRQEGLGLKSLYKIIEKTYKEKMKQLYGNNSN